MPTSSSRFCGLATTTPFLTGITFAANDFGGGGLSPCSNIEVCDSNSCLLLMFKLALLVFITSADDGSLTKVSLGIT